MKRVMMTALTAAATIALASPAFADVTKVAASSVQGTLVHGTGAAVMGPVVTGDLGANGPNIVNFSGTTSGPNNDFMLQGGGGQADITGATITNNNTYDILTGNIYLTNHQGMQDIEFGLTSGVDGTVSFVISAVGALGNPETFNFSGAIGTGDTFFAFLASNGEQITNVFFSADTPPSSFSLIKQVRIDVASGVPAAVPEPATWAMMLLGFGGIGAAMRRSRRRNTAVAQIA